MINKKDKEIKRNIILLVVAFIWTFYFLCSGFYTLGEKNMCALANGTLVKDASGNKVCINIVNIPTCKDSNGIIVEDISNFSYDFVNLT